MRLGHKGGRGLGPGRAGGGAGDASCQVGSDMDRYVMTLVIIVMRVTDGKVDLTVGLARTRNSDLCSFSVNLCKQLQEGVAHYRMGDGCPNHNHTLTDHCCAVCSGRRFIFGFALPQTVGLDTV